VAVTAAPDWVTVAFQAFVTFWSPGNENVSVQVLIALVPVLLMVRLAVNPPDHSFGTYATWHVPVGVGPLTVQVRVADPVAPVVSVAVMVVVLVPVVVGVPVMRPDGLMVRPGGRPVAV
jgi:hypothetical protein